MKNLSEYITEAIGKEQSLPYTFDIYNEGPKNVNFKITKTNIKKAYFNIKGNWEDSIACEVPGFACKYEEYPNKESTKNWTELPKVKSYMYNYAYSGKSRESNNWNAYNREWDAYLKMLKPYFKGKLSVTLDKLDNKYLVLKVNHPEFQKERNERIKELEDKENLKTMKAEYESAENERKAKEEAERKAKEEAGKKWDAYWKSLSDDERQAWSMGYGRGSGSYTGD